MIFKKQQQFQLIIQVLVQSADNKIITNTINISLKYLIPIQIDVYEKNLFINTHVIFTAILLLPLLLHYCYYWAPQRYSTLY